METRLYQRAIDVMTSFPCNYVPNQFKHRKLCFVQLQSMVRRHFVSKGTKQLHFVLRCGSLELSDTKAMLYS